MKKYLILTVFVFFALAPSAFAAGSGFVPLAPIPGLTDVSPTSVVNADSLASFFNNLYKYLIGLAAILAVIEIIWGGLEISTKDSVSSHSDGKARIQQAIIGLVLVLLPVIVFSIINPSILNLSLNLPPIDTGAGCTITGTLLKKAACPKQKDAEDFANSCPTGSGHLPFLFTPPYTTTCGTEKGDVTGPYAFADTSSGALALIFGYSKYEPLASTASNPNNGSAVVQFAASCTADGGTTCMSSVKLPCATSVIQVITNGSVSAASWCWNISLYCTDGNSGAGGCDSNPKFTPVQIK